jgi:hypothetical protein
MTFPGLCDTSTETSTAACSPTNYQATTLKNTRASPYAPDDYGCKGTQPAITPYNNDPQYLILGFPSDSNFSSVAPYRTSDQTGSSLNQSSGLVEAVDAGTGGCGIQTPGGESTFYAGVIVAAQQYLQAYHTPNIQDVIIFLSDGNANATGASGDVAGSKMAGSVKQTGAAASLTGMIGGLFQSANACAQAVAAANWAKGYKETDGTYTQIYSVSYNSANVQCTNDTSTITDCTTMLDIASNPTEAVPHYFFSVPQKTGGTVCTGAVKVANLANVFNVLATDLSSARLLPNGAF